MAEFTLRIDGMHCGSCVRRVSQALAATPGVVVNEVRVGAARLTAAEDPAPVGSRHCRARQGWLCRASGIITRRIGADPGLAQHRIADTARSGDDVRLVPAPRGGGPARDGGRGVGTRGSDGASRQAWCSTRHWPRQSNWWKRFAEPDTMRCCRARAMAVRAPRMRVRARNEGVGDAGRGRGGHAAGHAAGNGDGRGRSFPDARICPGSMRIPAGAALVSAADDGGGCGLGGARHLWSAMRALRHGATNMNTLVSLGTAVAFAYSAFATIAPAPGRAGLLRCGAADSRLSVVGQEPGGAGQAARSGGAGFAFAAAACDGAAHCGRRADGCAARRGSARRQHSWFCPASAFPVDATILEGRTTVDESMLTGESTPLEREAGRPRAGRLAQLRRRGGVPRGVAGRGHGAGADCAHGGPGAKLARAHGAARRPRQRDLCARGAGAGCAYVCGVAAGRAFAAVGAGQHGGRAGDRVPVRDGAGCACRAHGGRGPRRAAWRALQRRRSAGAARASRRDRSRQDGNADGGTAGAGEDTGTSGTGNSGAEKQGSRERDLLRMAAAAEERSNHPLAHAIVDCCS